MHKIDREQLKGALEALKGDVSDWERFLEKHGLSPHSLRKQAAENWLEIGDPGYMPNCDIVQVGYEALKTENSKDSSEQWRAVRIFKTMIAKAGQQTCKPSSE